MKKWFFSFFIFSFLLGPFGFFGILFAILLYFSGRKNEKIKLVTFQTKEPDISVELKIHQAIEAPQDSTEHHLDIISYHEILDQDDNVLKINLISMLTFKPSRDSVQLLKKAVYNVDESVRVLASTALQKMDDHYISKILELQKLADSEMDLQKKARFLCDLASSYDEYLFSSLVSRENLDFYLQKMNFCFDEAIRLAPQNKQIWHRLVRSKIRYKDLKSALLLIEEFEQRFPKDFSLEIWKAEIFFLTREIAKLKKIMQNLNSPVSNEKMKKVLEWWNETAC